MKRIPRSPPKRHLQFNTLSELLHEFIAAHPKGLHLVEHHHQEKQYYYVYHHNAHEDVRGCFTLLVNTLALILPYSVSCILIEHILIINSHNNLVKLYIS